MQLWSRFLFSRGKWEMWLCECEWYEGWFLSHYEIGFVDNQIINSLRRVHLCRLKLCPLCLTYSKLRDLNTVNKPVEIELIEFDESHLNTMSFKGHEKDGMVFDYVSLLCVRNWSTWRIFLSIWINQGRAVDLCFTQLRDIIEDNARLSSGCIDI